MRETQKAEGRRLALPAVCPTLGRRAAKLDHPRLLSMQFQFEPPESLPQFAQETISVRLVPEANHEVIGVADDDHLPPRLPLSPLLGP